jgi:serine/threonine protein kinase
MRTLLQSISHLHENGLMHRDLKPENIVFRNKDKDSDVIIVDFGFIENISNPK